jgi:hydroxyacylglutathione hydrolase
VKIDVVVDDSTVRIQRLELSTYEANSYVVVNPKTKQSVLIDVPPGARTLIKELRGTELVCILLTHSHIDHYAGLRAFRNLLVAPVAVHEADNREWLPFPPEIVIKGGEVFEAGDVKIEAIFTPGHTPGSTCFRVGSYLLSGDTVFPGGPGRTMTAPAFKQIMKSITEKIVPLPDDMRVFPGHGSETVLGKEKREIAGFLSREHSSKLHGDVLWSTT